MRSGLERAQVDQRIVEIEQSLKIFQLLWLGKDTPSVLPDGSIPLMINEVTFDDLPKSCQARSPTKWTIRLIDSTKGYSGFGAGLIQSPKMENLREN